MSDKAKTDNPVVRCSEQLQDFAKQVSRIDKPLKEYLLILDWVDLGHAINSAGHAVLMADLEWRDDPVYQDWRENSFRKVTCKVTPEEFEQAKQYDDYVAVTEMAFDKKEVALIFKPRSEWPKFFKFLKLYS